jgi:hypothetical protein
MVVFNSRSSLNIVMEIATVAGDFERNMPTPVDAPADDSFWMDFEQDSGMNDDG